MNTYAPYYNYANNTMLAKLSTKDIFKKRTRRDTQDKVTFASIIIVKEITLMILSLLMNFFKTRYQIDLMS